MKKKFLFFVFVLTFLGFANDPVVPAGSFEQQRIQMIQSQIKNRGIKDPSVLSAMKKVERHLFVPSQYRKYAYGDFPLSIGHEQTISQPYVVAYMTEALGLKPGDRVLEIGTGSGYQAAVLAEIAEEVFSIEIIEPLAESAQERLEELGYQNVRVMQGDGYLGWPEHAPFDAIILTAAPPEIPDKLTEQLKEGGRMVAPVGESNQELLLVTKEGGQLSEKRLIPVRFVPMVRD